jgi:hypothetical protein
VIPLFSCYLFLVCSGPGCSSLGGGFMSELGLFDSSSSALRIVMLMFLFPVAVSAADLAAAALEGAS